ncbi:MAG: LysR family transcriptional regulator [Caulobacteraceae bacterium]|nr:LysR family transcriptional regulator [Caulobacteraceae bacterium]
MTMHEMNLKSVDLNLLTALGALLRHRHVTKAADEVGLSQPAMSRALMRLRHLFGDPLLVRGVGGLILTARAEALAPRLTLLLNEIKALLVEAPFDPAKARRTVTVVGTDSHAVTLIPPVLARIRKEAPGIDLVFKGFTPDVSQRVQRGEVDMVFSVANQPLRAGAASEPLRKDCLALVMRRGHPLSQTPFTIEDYGRCEHVLVSILDDGASEIDAILAASGVERRIALTTPHFMGALAAIAGTDMVMTLSRSVAERYRQTFRIGVQLAF